MPPMAALILSCANAPGLWQVDVIEDHRAQLTSLASQGSCLAPRSSLPPETKEGDILRDGRVDVGRTVAARARVRGLQRRAVALPLHSNVETSGRLKPALRPKLKGR